MSTGAGALTAVPFAGVMALIASMSPLRAAPSTWSSVQRSPVVVKVGAEPVTGVVAAGPKGPPVSRRARPAPDRTNAIKTAMTRGVRRYDKARLLVDLQCCSRPYRSAPLAGHRPKVPPHLQRMDEARSVAYLLWTTPAITR